MNSRFKKTPEINQNKGFNAQNENLLKEIIELNGTLIDKQKQLEKQFSILESILGIFDYLDIIDFSNSSALRFDKKDATEEVFNIEKDPHTMLNKRTAPRIIADEYDAFWEYTDLSTLNDRMKGQKVISKDFKCWENNWIRAMYIRIGDNVTEPLHQVAYTIRDITSDKEKLENVYSAVANLLDSLHIIDMEKDTIETLIASDIIRNVVSEKEDAQKAFYGIIEGICRKEYIEYMREFADLSTISERLRNKKYISSEFVGKFNGWTRMTCVPIDIYNDRITKIAISTQVIHTEKMEMINLIYTSNTDEITGLYNRRAYEEELDIIDESEYQDTYTIIAMDVNGLKSANDSLGHKAGDELIIGAADCIKKSFNKLGKLFRTGGDEFVAILSCGASNIDEALSNFDQLMEKWSGYYNKSLAISYGCASTEEYPGINIREIVAHADEKMYIAKSEYYKKKGIDRRK